MASNNTKESETGLIFSTQHFCLHDGPGIRSLVFFKGCPLRCTWCQNPESWKSIPELGFKAHLCTNCQTCISVCPANAMKTPGQIRPENCRQCFTCAEACPSGALIRFGDKYSTELLLKELRPEYPFYHSSRGGVTFSGGEPTLSAEFAVQLARSLKQDGIHMAIETCGLFHMEKDAKPAYEPKLLPTTSRKATRELFRLVDLVLFDIKLFQEKTHQKFCGTTNRLIKDNLTLMACLFHKGEGPVIWPRMPVIPGITDTTDNLEDWGNLLGELELNQLTLVPYHNLGNAKREWLQLEPGPRLDTLTRESLEKTRRILTKIGITCYEPGEEEWPQTSQSSPSKPN